MPLPLTCFHPAACLPALAQVLARAAGRYSLVQVREAVEGLQNEGHLYSTIDENHYKSCNA
jgi:hypothetical protein